MFSTLSLKDKKCNDFMQELSALIPHIDVRIRQIIQNVFLENSENKEQFNCCIDAHVKNSEVQATVKKIAEKYFQPAEGGNKRKNPPPQSDREQPPVAKRMRLGSKEKRKAENALPDDETRSKRRRTDPSTESEERSHSFTFTESLRLLATDSDPETIIETCIYLRDILLHRTVSNNDLIDFSSHDFTFVLSLLQSKNFKVAEPAWSLIKHLLSNELICSKFNESSTLLSFCEIYHNKLEMPDTTEWSQDFSTEQTQKILLHCYRGLFFYYSCNPTFKDEAIIKRGIDFLMPLLSHSIDDLASHAYAAINTIHNYWQTLLPPSFNIKTAYPSLLKRSHSNDFEILLQSLTGLANILLQTETPQVCDQILKRMTDLLQHENEFVISLIVMGSFHHIFSNLNAPNTLLTVHKKTKIESQAILLTKMLPTFLLHDNCWVVEAANKLLNQLLPIEGCSDAFCEHKGIEILVQVVETCALEAETQHSSSANSTENALTSKLAKTAAQIIINSLCKLIPLFTPGMANQILNLMIKLTGSHSHEIAMTSAKYLGELSFVSKEQFQGVNINVAKMSYKTLIDLCHPNQNESVISCAVDSLNRMLANTDLYKACVAVGGIEKLQQLLVNPSAKFLAATLACLYKWTKAQSGEKLISDALFGTALSFLENPIEAIASAALQFFPNRVIDNAISDEMGMHLSKKVLPLLVSTNETLLERAYGLLASMLEAKKEFKQCAEVIFHSGLLDKLIKKMASNADWLASFKPLTTEKVALCFINLILMQIARGDPLEHVCLLSKLTKQTAKVAEAAFWLIHKIAISHGADLAPPHYIGRLVQTCFPAVVEGLKHANLNIVIGAAWCFGKLTTHPSAFDFALGNLMKSAIDAHIENLKTQNERLLTLSIRCLGTLVVHTPPPLNFCQYVAEKGGLAMLAKILNTSSIPHNVEKSLWTICALSMTEANRVAIKQLLPLSRIIELLKSEIKLLRDGALHLMSNLKLENPADYFASEKELLAPLIIELLKEKFAIAILSHLYPILLPALDDTLKEKAFDCLLECMQSPQHQPTEVAWLLSSMIGYGINTRPGFETQIDLLHHADINVSKVTLNYFKSLFQSNADKLFECLCSKDFVLSLSRHFGSAVGKEIIALAQADARFQKFLEDFILSGGGNHPLDCEHTLRLLTCAKDKSVLQDLLMASMSLSRDLDANLFITYLKMISLINNDKPMLTYTLPDTIQQEGDQYKAFYETKKYTDATLKVSDTDGMQLEIKCHRAVLALASSHFNTMFSASWEKNSPNIEIKEVHLEVFEKVIQYLYLKQYAFTSVDEACAVWQLADRFSLVDLKMACLKFFERHLSNETVETILGFAEESIATEVEKLTLQWLGEHYLLLPEHLQALVQQKWMLVRKALTSDVKKAA